MAAARRLIPLAVWLQLLLHTRASAVLESSQAQVSKDKLGPPEGNDHLMPATTPTTTEQSTTTEDSTTKGHDDTTSAQLLIASTVSTTPVPLRWDTTTLPPVGACLDQNETGVRFRNGQIAECKDLINYCDHPTLGHKVKGACAKTCGRCDLSTMSSIMTRCVDQPEDAHPVITVGGIPANCSYLEYFCRGFNGSEYVMRKCPRTCLFCNPEPEVVTTTRWQFSTSFVDTAASGVGCSRRRRFGFCYSRRRRMS